MFCWKYNNRENYDCRSIKGQESVPSGSALLIERMKADLLSFSTCEIDKSFIFLVSLACQHTIGNWLSMFLFSLIKNFSEWTKLTSLVALNARQFYILSLLNASLFLFIIRRVELLLYRYLFFLISINNMSTLMFLSIMSF